LLVLALGAPLVAGIRARGHPLVPAALAAYVAYLIHAGVDWDWEMGAVTVAALVCAAALLAAASPDDAPLLSPRVRGAGVVAALVLASVAFVGLVGASALSASDDALSKGHYGEANLQALKAERWWGWSPDPWRQLGDIQSAQGDSFDATLFYQAA